MIMNLEKVYTFSNSHKLKNYIDPKYVKKSQNRKEKCKNNAQKVEKLYEKPATTKKNIEKLVKEI